MAVPGLESATFSGPGAPSALDPREHHEWPGSCSSKWMDPSSNRVQSRHLVETFCRNGDGRSLARVGMGTYFSDRSGLIREEGKKSISVPYSDVMHWRPCKRPLAHPGADHLEKPEGLKQVE